jgi:hypothetical protein
VTGACDADTWDAVVVGARGRRRDGVPAGPSGTARPARRPGALVEAPVERVGGSVSATTYGYWTGLQTDGYEWNFVPRAASGAIPTNQGQACVFASSKPDSVGRGGLDALTRLVAKSSPPLAARLADADAPSTFRTFRGNRAFVR